MYNQLPSGNSKGKIIHSALSAFTFALILGGLNSSSSAAVLSVTNYGAAGDGIRDDRGAIQQAIDSSGSGDTIQFPPGTYRISDVINLAANRVYQGVNATLLGPGGTFILRMPADGAVNITVNGLTLDGGGLSTNMFTSAANNIQITNCTIRNVVVAEGDNWTIDNGIFMPVATTNSVITNNHFSNIFTGGNRNSVDTDAVGIWGANLNNVSITDNVFDQVNEGIGLGFSGGGSYAGVVIARNIGTGIHRMGIEIHRDYDSTATQLLVDSNQFSNFLNPFWITFGFSIDAGIGTIIRNNLLDANLPVAPGGDHYGYGMEVFGNVQVTNNTILHSFSAAIAVGPSLNLSITDNWICGWSGFESGIDSITEEPGTISGLVISGNTIQSVCPASSPPSVTITAPAPNSILSGTIQAIATATATAGIQDVRFILDGWRVLGDVQSSPYSITVDTTVFPDGNHYLQAIATDALSSQGASAVVPIQIYNGGVSAGSGPMPQQGLVFWLNAGAGVVQQNSHVTAWNDQSGSGISAIQPNISRQPSFVPGVVNGQPVVRFSNQSLSFPLSINGLTGMTIFLVSSAAVDQTCGWSKSEGAAIFWNETVWWGTSYLSPFQSNVCFRFGTTQTNNWPQYFRPNNIGTKFTLSTSMKNGTTDSLFVNGQLALSQSNALGRIAGAVGSGVLGQGYNSTYFSGDIAEVLVYNRALSSAEQQTVEAYLRQKYAIQ